MFKDEDETFRREGVGLLRASLTVYCFCVQLLLGDYMPHSEQIPAMCLWEHDITGLL